jgi:hypothetical protein
LWYIKNIYEIKDIWRFLGWFTENDILHVCHQKFYAITESSLHCIDSEQFVYKFYIYTISVITFCHHYLSWSKYYVVLAIFPHVITAKCAKPCLCRPIMRRWCQIGRHMRVCVKEWGCLFCSYSLSAEIKCYNVSGKQGRVLLLLNCTWVTSIEGSMAWIENFSSFLKSHLKNVSLDDLLTVG